MSLLPHQLELLSPARDADIGIEAVNHGADAVYIGGPAFGARASAGNEMRDLERLIRHAHRFHSRIFVTLNTILRDDELEGARRMAWQVYEAGADALIIQDMGLLEIDLPPIQLHASTQTDIRTPEKARFLQDAGLSQIVLARELTVQEIAAIRAATDPERCTIEFFIHGALCVAYSGQCYISHAHTGRSANRGDCSQACRLPYQVTDAAGRFIAHDKHVLSMKDNNQSANLRPLIDAGVRSFKIEGRYKDMAYVKNVTAHYRRLLDEIIEERETSAAPLARSSSGQTRFTFTPDPNQNFNREFTDYFVNGRKEDIGAFDTPKNPGQAIGWVTQVGPNWVELETHAPETVLHNGDGLCYWDLQKELVGVAINRAEAAPGKSRNHWRVFPKDPMEGFRDLRRGTEINRNRDMDWVRTLEKKSSERRIGLWAHFTDTDAGFALTLTDEDGFTGTAEVAHAHEPATDAVRAEGALREQIGRFGATIFHAHDIAIAMRQPWFVPASVLNPLRRDAVAALEAARTGGLQRLPRARPAEPPAPFPEDTLTYLANVFNQKAHDFYMKHGVKVIDAAYESQEEDGEVSLMITKHCVRFSMSLCPKQAKGVIGVKGTIKAEPLHLINGKEKLTLRFDCKPCEMHVVGRIKKSVQNQQAREAQAAPMQFYRTRPVPGAPH
ncbi:peptidase U32 family protein [Paracidovorax avenae]|uniref:peptidase U32 family protein n=1 Tax=Paracidovorax avenae TaxID=80867 RepID=UPI000D21BEB6|nr:U32 family peptidase [Paracidovorax avenae]AVS95925.1 collagenase-like protease [Paracidovorax avenae]AVT02609.1 collagenase-like protease [Paracidovorax avenae]AVT09450.1 collagenase-like protease [Paracidovorax avenae]